MPDADVAIVGAGPAGSTLATLLASRGLDVLLVDRARFPRPKLCGAFLSAETIPMLARSGALPRVRAASPARIDRFLLSAPGAPVADAPLPWSALGLSRGVLDEQLSARAREAGAHVLEGTRVLRVRRLGDAVELDAVGAEGDATLRARCVVNAAGRLGGIETRPAPARRAGLHAAFARTCVAREPVEAVEIHAFEGGYLGLNRIEGGLVNACGIVRCDRLREHGSFDAVLQAASLRNGALARRLAGLDWIDGSEVTTGAIETGAPPAPSGGRLSIGDAAATIAPVCGDGMAMAIRSAELADAAIARHGITPERWSAACAEHQRAWRRELGARLAVGRALHAGLVRPGWARALAFAAHHAPPVVGLAVALTRDGRQARRSSATLAAFPEMR